ncbi:MAG: hypothetical protein EOP62_21610 [Sphingomonadales bacterium]|nr:MAG: hypothetical protein EOP62_21610 [Sphingomonadales bacterium]
MKVLHSAIRMLAVSPLILAAPALAQSSVSSGGDGAAEIAAAANVEGPCHWTRSLKQSGYSDGDKIKPGKYLFYARPNASLDIELIGAGGSGGGTTMGTGHPKWGAGGSAGEIKRWVAHKLEPGVYLLEVGAGGGEVQGRRSWQDYGVRAVNGAPGGGTAIKRCASGFRIIGANGGAGGAGDSSKVSSERANQRAGKGSDLIDLENGQTIGTGGAGGRWQQSGADGSGVGAGGGGQGAYDGSNKKSGRGAGGQALIVGL